MKKILLLAICLILAGCAESMSRQEVIASVKECNDAGMRAAIISSTWTYEQKRVICLLRETP